MIRKEPTTLGRRVRELREAAGISVTDLCKRAGVARQTLIGLELGYEDQAMPRLRTLTAIAKALGKDLPELMSRAPRRRAG
jgi:transcriptional regulator with XRE-family HTH domain